MGLPVLRRIIFAVLITAVFFLLIEVGLRLFGFAGRADDTRFVLNPEWDYPEFFLKDHDLFWKFRPNQVIRSGFFVEGEYRINNHGLRGPDFTDAKPPGTCRVVCLGNSCTFGWRVGEDDAYPRQLEAMLNAGAPVPHYEVINAGVTGYSSLQGLRFFEHDVLRWHPDLIVVSYNWNDHWAGAQDIADKNQYLPPQWVLDVQNALGRTLTYRWLKYLVFSIKHPPPAEFSHTSPVYRVCPGDFRQILNEIIRLATSRGIDVLLATAPIAPRPGQEYTGLYAYHQQYNEIIRSFAGAPNVSVADVAAEFTSRPGLFDDPEHDVKHYNVLGHRLVARMLAESIGALRRQDHGN